MEAIRHLVSFKSAKNSENHWPRFLSDEVVEIFELYPKLYFVFSVSWRLVISYFLFLIHMWVTSVLELLTPQFHSNYSPTADRFEVIL